MMKLPYTWMMTESKSTVKGRTNIARWNLKSQKQPVSKKTEITRVISNSSYQVKIINLKKQEQS